MKLYDIFSRYYISYYHLDINAAPSLIVLQQLFMSFFFYTAYVVL